MTARELIANIYEGELSLIPRSTGPADLSEVRALLRLPETSRLDILFDKNQITETPLHRYDEFITEWENNFFNKVIREQYKRRESHASHPQWTFPDCWTERRAKINAAKLDAAVTNALNYSDTEDDAFSP